MVGDPEVTKIGYVQFGGHPSLSRGGTCMVNAKNTNFDLLLSNISQAVRFILRHEEQ
jgi:hypothetical protein